MANPGQDDLDELDLGQTIRGFAPRQKLFRRFTLQKILGRGGMGVVWLAQDDELDRQVALKFLPDLVVHDRALLDDLKRETKRNLDLTHYNIVRIYDLVQDETAACISMEYVDGDTLSALRVDRPGRIFHAAELTDWVLGLCEGLDYAHRRAKIVHRDLKPANLMVNSQNDIKITDFGIARNISDNVSMLTRSSQGTAGTLVYMSPQQWAGERPTSLDDIYSVGATIYELLTSKPPFYTGNIDRQIEKKTPPSMKERREELNITAEPIPAVWEEIVAACLAKDPAQRPQSTREIAARLCADGSVGASLPAAFLRGTPSGGAAGGPATSPPVTTGPTAPAIPPPPTTPPAVVALRTDVQLPPTTPPSRAPVAPVEEAPPLPRAVEPAPPAAEEEAAPETLVEVRLKPEVIPPPPAAPPSEPVVAPKPEVAVAPAPPPAPKLPPPPAPVAKPSPPPAPAVEARKPVAPPPAPVPVPVISTPPPAVPVVTPSAADSPALPAVPATPERTFQPPPYEERRGNPLALFGTIAVVIALAGGAAFFFLRPQPAEIPPTDPSKKGEIVTPTPGPSPMASPAGSPAPTVVAKPSPDPSAPPQVATRAFGFFGGIRPAGATIEVDGKRVSPNAVNGTVVVPISSAGGAPAEIVIKAPGYKPYSVRAEATNRGVDAPVTLERQTGKVGFVFGRNVADYPMIAFTMVRALPGEANFVEVDGTDRMREAKDAVSGALLDLPTGFYRVTLLGAQGRNDPHILPRVLKDDLEIKAGAEAKLTLPPSYAGRYRYEFTVGNLAVTRTLVLDPGLDSGRVDDAYVETVGNTTKPSAAKGLKVADIRLDSAGVLSGWIRFSTYEEEKERSYDERFQIRPGANGALLVSGGREQAPDDPAARAVVERNLRGRKPEANDRRGESVLKRLD